MKWSKHALDTRINPVADCPFEMGWTLFVAIVHLMGVGVLGLLGGFGLLLTSMAVNWIAVIACAIVARRTQLRALARACVGLLILALLPHLYLGIVKSGAFHIVNGSILIVPAACLWAHKAKEWRLSQS